MTQMICMQVSPSHIRLCNSDVLYNQFKSVAICAYSLSLSLRFRAEEVERERETSRFQ